MFWKQKNKENSSREVLGYFDGNEKIKNEVLSAITFFVDGILIFDRSNKISLINPQAEKSLEVKKGEVLGKSILQLNSFGSFRPLVSLLGGDIQEVLRQTIPIQGNKILEVSSLTMKNREGKIGSLVVLHDVTREKLVEAMKSEFVTLAAHQLRTPTSGIKWSLRMLLDGDLGKMSGDQKVIVEKAYNSNDKVIQLINDLLNVARIEEGKFLTKISLYNIEEIIHAVTDFYSDIIKKKKIKFEIKKPLVTLPEVMVDSDKIKIAIDNLVDNAIRYTMPGGKVTISIIPREDKEEIEIQIQDTGLGIPEKQKNEVFHKFFRGENIMKVETEGTGLGLFIAKSIIEMHGGQIWFESKEGAGTIFYFTLPLKKTFAEYLGKEFY